MYQLHLIACCGSLIQYAHQNNPCSNRVKWQQLHRLRFPRSSLSRLLRDDLSELLRGDLCEKDDNKIITANRVH